MSEGSTQPARAPAVVAIVVTRDPGPWFDDTLRGLASQDYDDLSVLVLVSGGSDDPTDRVAAILPHAFVRRLPEDRGYGAAVNDALGMVEGASFFLLCHDDCALELDAVHLLVEESFRSNAGVVSPKMAHWDDPRALLHVGQSVDKTGAVVERVQDGEIDAGQHDGVRDVFVAPGGCTLVRADLLTALGGYDRVITAMGEDLNLSWRAHVAGARVVVAPAARVRHLELVAGGSRAPIASGAPSLQALQRRNELYTVLTCYSWVHLLRVLPQEVALAAGEAVVAALVGDLRRVRSVVHAWQWNLGRIGQVRRRRAEVQASRAVPDAEVRSLQLRRSARLSTYMARLTHQGVEVAHGLRPRGRTRPSGEDEPSPGAPAASPSPGVGDEALGMTGTIGSAFSEDADFDDLDDLGRRGSGLHGPRQLLATRQSRLVTWLVVVLVLVLGTRDLLGTPWPLLGQYVPFTSWAATWHAFVSASQPAGVGSHAPARPAFGLLGLLGTVLVGQMGLLQEVVLLGCVPLGAWGLSRLLRSFASPRARLAGVATYLALPLAYDALARGRWDGLVAYAATPWIVGQLASATGLEPFGGAGAGTTWRRRLPGRILVAGAIEAAAVAVAPGMVVVVVLVGLGIAGGSLVAGGRRGGGRALLAAVGSTVVALVALLPWTVSTLAAGRGALSVLGLPGRPDTLPGWGGLLRMAVGPIGGSPLGWLLVAVALAPLLVGRGPRFAWAARLWAVALLAWWIALVSAKAWAVPFAPSVDVLLAPAAVAVAVGAGLGVSAFETDLAGYRFGWRQAVAAVSVVALVVGALPTLAEAANGRWGVPTAGYAQAAGIPATHGRSTYRVLWIGDPQALPLGGWSIGPGLAYATSTDGTPTLRDLWPPGSPGPASSLARDVRVAMRGQTVRLGQLLAGAHVRYVVVVHALAPSTPGAVLLAYPVPAGLDAALARQEDLRTVPVSVGGLTVFENADLRARSPLPVTGTGSAGLLDPLGAALELLLWLGMAVALLGRRRWLGRLGRPRHIGRPGSRRRRAAAASLADGHAAGAHGGGGHGGGGGHTPRSHTPRSHTPGSHAPGSHTPRRPGRGPLADVDRDWLIGGRVGGSRWAEPRHRRRRAGRHRGGRGTVVRLGAMTGRETRAGTGLASGGGCRMAAVLGVLALAVAGGLAGGIASRRPPVTALQSAGLVAEAAPVGSQSSSWYCAGGPGPSGSTAQSRLLLVNAGSQPVPATVDVVDTKGATKQEPVTVPAHGEVGEAPAQLVAGDWLAARVDVGGGGVTASELVDGSGGWAAAPCASETAPQWYFATGSTAAGSTLRMSVFNPTANLAVVDMTFVTASGVTAPQPYQGIVLEPGAFRSVTVGKYVQDQKQVAAMVSSRSGAVVATELQTYQTGGVSGMALRLGAPALSSTWAVPRAEDASGGTSELSVFNPSARPEHVSVRVRLSSGPLSPFEEKLGPDSVWTLDTGEEVRIPDGTDYAATVQAAGGPGVVVDRTAAGTPGSPAPQWGDDAAIVTASSQVTRWVVPALELPTASTPTSLTLVLQNPGRQPVAALVSSLTATGVRRVARVSVPAGSLATVVAGTSPLLVTAAGPLAVVGDGSPAGAPATGVVPAIPEG